MSSAAQRFSKTAGVTLALVLASAVLAGCAVTTGGAASPLAHGPAAASYLVCSGGHASRFPQREAVGRVCRPATSLTTVY